MPDAKPRPRLGLSGWRLAAAWTSADPSDAAKHGEQLPPGVVRFTPPLRLHNISVLRGTADRTELIPIGTAPGPLVIVSSSLGGDYVVGYPHRTVVEGISIRCSAGGQTGLVVRGAVMTFDRVIVRHCTTGASFEWAVNVAMRDSHFTHNVTGVQINGNGPGGGLGGSVSVTTLRFSGCRISGSSARAVTIGHGVGVIFDDASIIEGNTGIPLFVAPALAGAEISVMLRDVWLEANGGGIHDPHRVVRYEGLTGHH